MLTTLRGFLIIPKIPGRGFSPLAINRKGRQSLFLTEFLKAGTWLDDKNETTRERPTASSETTNLSFGS
jgi:hypothetical protein